MLTKYILTIGSTEHAIPDECLKNWDEVSFSLKRTDYSGVMRSFSTEFVFVGDIKDMLWELYLSDGFNASASVAVYTITDTHEWEKQYESALDFSTVEIEDEALSINALDNDLASKLKSKKSQKYEYPVDGFNITRINVERVELASYATYKLPKSDNQSGTVTAILNENSSQIISKEYLEPCNEVRDGEEGSYGAGNSFFAKINKSGITVSIRLTGKVRCYFCPYTKDNTLTPGADVPVSYLNVMKLIEDENGGNKRTPLFSLISDDLQYKVVHGNRTNIFINRIKENVASSLQNLQSMAKDYFGKLDSDHNGIFGVVGSEDDYTHGSYWENNVVYEYRNGAWVNKGAAKDYYQDRDISDGTVSDDGITPYSGSISYNGRGTCEIPAGNDGAVLYLELSGKMVLHDGEMNVTWADPVRSTLSCRGISPLELINRLVKSIAGDRYSATIAEDASGMLSSTKLLAAEDLRQIYDAKIYTTFGNFADWMSSVFGYTYRADGNVLQFVHRSDVFTPDVVKVIENVSDFKFDVEDGIIYSQVDAGYSKKEYGEIDGRLETNFTNHYTTGYTLTDKKLTLVSKYRADSYGVEFTARKSESETKDDKADEDVFFVRIVSDHSTGITTYTPSNQKSFAPAVCVDNNKAYIAAVGNGKAVTLTMTSSDGNNALADIEIPSGTALFSAGVIEFTTDDMALPPDLNALVQVDFGGYRYTGFIREAEARFGRLNGVEYKLIVKDITAL